MLATTSTATTRAPTSSSSSSGTRRCRRPVARRARATTSSAPPPPLPNDLPPPATDRGQSPPGAASSWIAATTAAAACCALALSTATLVALPFAAIAAPSSSSSSSSSAVVVSRAAEAIADAFQNRQYYVTGDLPEGLFDDQCVFIDPTTRVVGAKKYATVVAQLFDGAHSRADLLSLSAPGPEPNSVEIRWRLEGQLSLPGNPPIKAYTGSTLYRLDADSGRVKEQVETWDVGAFDAFASSFLPSWLWQGAPPAPPVEVLLAEQQQKR